MTYVLIYLYIAVIAFALWHNKTGLFLLKCIMFLVERRAMMVNKYFIYVCEESTTLEQSTLPDKYDANHTEKYNILIDSFSVFQYFWPKNIIVCHNDCNR